MPGQLLVLVFVDISTDIWGLSLYKTLPTMIGLITRVWPPIELVSCLAVDLGRSLIN